MNSDDRGKTENIQLPSTENMQQTAIAESNDVAKAATSNVKAPDGNVDVIECEHVVVGDSSAASADASNRSLLNFTQLIQNFRDEFDCTEKCEQNYNFISDNNAFQTESFCDLAKQENCNCSTEKLLIANASVNSDVATKESSMMNGSFPSSNDFNAWRDSDNSDGCKNGSENCNEEKLGQKDVDGNNEIVLETMNNGKNDFKEPSGKNPSSSVTSMRLAAVFTSSSIMAEFNKIARQAPNRSISLKTALNTQPCHSTHFKSSSRPANLNSTVPTLGSVQNQSQNQATTPDSSGSTASLLTDPSDSLAPVKKSDTEQLKPQQESNDCAAKSPTDRERSSGDSFEVGFRYKQSETFHRFSSRPYSSYLSSRRYYDCYKRGRLANQSQSMPTLTKDLSKSTSSFLESDQSESGTLTNSVDTEEEKKEAAEKAEDQENNDKQLSHECNGANCCDESFKLTKRYHIIAELVSVERDYVDSLTVINNKYLPALRANEFWDSNVAVEQMCREISKIVGHHEQLLLDLATLWENYNEEHTVGDKFIATFRRPEVVETYCNFIEHFDNAARFLDVALLSKPAFNKFEEEFRKETGVKLPLMALLIKPAQRIPRYELLLKRLADHTDQAHADFLLLTEAIEVVHKVALNINDVQIAQDKRIITFKQLEDSLGIDIMSTDRDYLRHDVVQLLNTHTEKLVDSCHLFLFSDYFILAAVKKKSAVSLKAASNVMLHFAGGTHEFIESTTRFKVILQLPLSEVSCSLEYNPNNRRKTANQNPNEAIAQLQSERSVVEQMVEMTAKLNSPHQQVDDALQELLFAINAKIGRLKMEIARDRKLFASTSNLSSKIALCIGSDQKLYEVAFQSPERKATWEKIFNEAKAKLAKASD